MTQSFKMETKKVNIKLYTFLKKWENVSYNYNLIFFLKNLKRKLILLCIIIYIIKILNSFQVVWSRSKPNSNWALVVKKKLNPILIQVLKVIFQARSNICTPKIYHKVQQKPQNCI